MRSSSPFRVLTPSAHETMSTAGDRTQDSLTLATDEALLARICDGDKEALALLFRRYARLVRTVASRIVRDNSEADDLLQDIFLFIFHKSKLFEVSKCTARSWIVQVAYSRAIDRRRQLTSRHFYDHLQIDEDVLDSLDPRTELTRYEDSLEGTFGKDGLKRMFEALSDNEKETLKMHFFDGYEFDEIATKIGQSVTSIRHRYYRGLNKLRKCMFENKQRQKLASKPETH